MENCPSSCPGLWSNNQELSSFTCSNNSPDQNFIWKTMTLRKDFWNSPTLQRAIDSFRNGILGHVMTIRNSWFIWNWIHNFHLPTKNQLKIIEDIGKRFDQSITFNELKIQRIFARSLLQILEICKSRLLIQHIFQPISKSSCSLNYILKYQQYNEKKCC